MFLSLHWKSKQPKHPKKVIKVLSSLIQVLLYSISFILISISSIGISITIISISIALDLIKRWCKNHFLWLIHLHIQYSQKKGTKVVTGAIPFQKVHLCSLFTPKGCI